MRLPSRVVVVALLVACGGEAGGPTTTPPPPPPVGPGAPAILAVLEGDGQSAFPGVRLPVAPAVSVSDANGRVVPGASVTFVVVSGGGTVAGTIATSNAQGVATAGNWTLGASGEQTIEARLGALTPVRFRATLLTGMVDAIVPATGGVVEITTPNHPYQGLKLTVPAGAYPTPGSWRFELGPPSTLPGLPNGFSVIGRPLRIETDRGRAGRLMTLRIPAPRIAGVARLFVLADTARRAMEMMPIVAEDSASITVAIGHLDASLLLSRGASGVSGRVATRGSAGSASGSISGSISMGYHVGVPLSALGITGTMLSNYLRDTWPAPENGSYRYPAGHGPAVALLNMFGQLQNTQYAGLVKVLPQFGILADTASFASLQIMADRHRQSPIAQQAIDDLSASLASASVPLRDSLAAINLWGGLAISKLPQLMVFEERFGTSSGRRSFATMFGNANGVTSFTSPSSPGTASTLTLGAGGFTARLDKEVVDAAPFNALGILPVGGSFIYPVDDFLDIVPTMTSALRAQGAARDAANRSLAADARFPDVTIEVQGATGGAWAAADTSIVVRDSSAALRAQCSNCTQALPQQGSATQQSVAVDDRSTNGVLTSQYALGPQSTRHMLNTLGIGDLAGAVMTSVDPQAALSTLGTAYRAAVPVRRMLLIAILHLTPDSILVAEDSVATISATVDYPPQRGYVVDWDFGDNEPVVRTTDTSEVNHTYAAPGTYIVRATLRSGSKGVVPNLLLGTTQGKVVVTGRPKPRWRFTSITKLAEVGIVNPNDPWAFWAGDGNVGKYVADYRRHVQVMTELLATPAKGLLYVLTTPTYSTVGIRRILPAGVDASVVTAPEIGLASNANGNSTLAITGTDSSGTISGTWEVARRLQATKDRNGVTLTGTFRVAEGGLGPTVKVHYVDYSFAARREP